MHPTLALLARCKDVVPYIDWQANGWGDVHGRMPNQAIRIGLTTKIEGGTQIIAMEEAFDKLIVFHEGCYDTVYEALYSLMRTRDAWAGYIRKDSR